MISNNEASHSGAILLECNLDGAPVRAVFDSVADQVCHQMFDTQGIETRLAWASRHDLECVVIGDGLSLQDCVRHQPRNIRRSRSNNHRLLLTDKTPKPTRQSGFAPERATG
jgi:hypothetical protein